MQLAGGVTAPMRARRLALPALGRLVEVTPALATAVADVVSELVAAAVTRGGAASRRATLEVELERRDDTLRVTVRDDRAEPFALEQRTPHATEAHACACGAERDGAWAELSLA